MKRSLFFILAALFIATSCEGPMGPEGPRGAQGPAGMPGQDGEGVNWYATSYTINENEWQLKGNPGDLNSYFYVYKPLNRLTEFVYKWGSVIAYIEIENGIKNGMPFVLHLGEGAGDGKEFLWTQTYDFDFTVGEVGFYITYSDFNTKIRPGAETFHVVLMW